MADRIYPKRHPAWRPITILVLLLALRAGTRAEGRPPEVVRRHVLALVDSGPRGWETDGEDPVQQLFELPLNHLGMTVLRHDVRDGPPPESALRDLRAVITVFEYTEEPVDWLWPWLLARREEGVRFAHLREFGPLLVGPDGFDPAPLARWLEPFGLGHDGGHFEVPLGVRIELADPSRTALEADPRGATVHRGPWAAGEDVRPWVETRCPSREERVRTPVVTGPFGGVALDPWVVRELPTEGSRRWHLDPYAFFREALDLEGVPAPHPSVLNGRRMFFCHVDGDGIESLSLARTGKLCGEVFRTEIVERFELPFTVSVIVASLTDELNPTEPTPEMRMAARLLAHPRVEAATHTVLHPFSWKVEAGGPFPLSAGFPGLGGYDPSPEGEVRESVRFVDEHLLPPGKSCRMVLWSGDACPPVASIREAERLGCLNLNGGVFRFDAMQDSVAYVSPLGRIVDGAIQVYCGAPNENVYPGYFETVPGIFRHVDQTIERTGEGRILKPANVYVHFYSVEHPTRLAVFEGLLRRWGIEEETAPVFASTYAGAVRDALAGAKILRTGDGWAFRDFGRCRTVRFDAETRPVDWDSSPGVLGARRLGGSLYLHLGSPDAKVRFAEEAPARPHLVQADHVLDGAERGPRRVAVTSRSVAPRFLEFGGLPPGGEVRVRIDDGSAVRKADAAGLLAIELPPGEGRIEVTLP